MNLLACPLLGGLSSYFIRGFSVEVQASKPFCAHAGDTNINNCYPLEHTALSTLWFSLGTSRAVGDSRSDAARKLFSG